MKEPLTYENVLELFKETSRQFKESEKKSEELDKKFKIEMAEHTKKFERELRASRKEWDKKMGELTGTLGRFVEGMVEPKLLELFRNRGIEVTEIYHNIQTQKEGLEGVEIDLLLANSEYTIAVEVKTILRVRDVDEHLVRLGKFQHNPIKVVKGSILIGAVAGMRIEENADRYAYRKGLFVLKQKGEIVEIGNDEKFRPKEWHVD